MGSSGYKSYIIGGLQTVDWDTPCVTASLVQKVYEFVSCSLKNNSDLILPERFKGQPSPTPGIENFFDASGELVLHLHADDILFWWKQIMHNVSPNTQDFTPQIVRTSGVYTSPISLTTQPAATTPASDPGKLILTFSAPKAGTVTIAGTDQNGVAISETLTFANETSKTTTKYFQTVNSGGITTAITGDNLGITCDKNTYTHTLVLGDEPIKGSTLEVVKGGIPSTYIGCMVNSAVINLADVMTLSLSMMAKRGYNSAKVPAAGAVPTDSETPTSVSGFTRVSEQVFPAWGLVLEIDKGSGYTTIPISSLTLTLDNALRFLDRFRNIRTRPQPVRGANRNYSLRVGIDYDTTQNDFDPAFLYAKEVGAKVHCYRTPFAGAEYKIEVQLPRCQITAFPDPAVTDYSEIIQELNLRPIRTKDAATSDELQVILTSVSAT